MSQWFLLIHILGAIAMGFYFLMPFMLGRTGKLSGAKLAGYVSVLRSMNRIGQFGLLFELLTGGYLISSYKGYTTQWLILVLLFLVALGAVSGILGVRLKKLVEAAESGGNIAPQKQSSQVLSIISAVFLVVIVFLMVNYGSI